VSVERAMKSRGDVFAERPATGIWKEVPAPDNPYAADAAYCHGYPLSELIEKRGFIDMLFLLLTGELPGSGQRDLLNRLMVGLCNPGPRHPAVRAGMMAAVSKTVAPNILPLSLAVMGGEHLGAMEVERSMRFLRRHRRRDGAQVGRSVVRPGDKPDVGDTHVAPGFGELYGGPDRVTARVAHAVSKSPGAGATLAWCHDFVSAIEPHGFSWLSTGLAAAAFLDLGLHPRVGAGLYQFVSAPGILAHAMEMANKPLTAMPFLSQDNYVME
jgi:citrate synthase